MTRAGNGHARRLLIEAAWQERRAPGKGVRVRLAPRRHLRCASERVLRSVACTAAG